MQKETYDRTELEVIRFMTEDVITTSQPEESEYQGEFPPAPNKP